PTGGGRWRFGPTITGGVSDVIRHPAMLPNPEDTIVALSSAPGPGLRAIVRLSGSQALRIARTVFHTGRDIAPDLRRRYDGELRLPGLHAPLPADLYLFPAPRTYTGQE